MTLHFLAMALALAVLPITAHAQSPAATAPKAAQAPTPKQLRALVEQAALRQAPEGTPTRRIGDLHASFMDTARIDALGLTLLRGELERIAEAADKQDIGELYGQGNFIYVPFRVDVRPDSTRAGRYAVAVSQSGLDLHEREPTWPRTRTRSRCARSSSCSWRRCWNSWTRRTARRGRRRSSPSRRPSPGPAGPRTKSATTRRKRTRGRRPSWLHMHQASTGRRTSPPTACRRTRRCWSLICTWGWMGALPQSVYDLQFDFYGRVRRGATEQPERGRRAYDFVRRALPVDLERLAQGSEAASAPTDGPDIRRNDVYGNAKRAHAWNWQRQLARLRPTAPERDAPAPSASKEK
jgi:hypothetical protein